jgi:methionyl-tRNA formyltransferase
MRTALVGTLASTRVTVEALAEAGHPPLTLFTLPPGRASRHSDYLDLAPVAARHGVRVVHAPNVNAPEVLDELRGLDLDYLLVIGWSQICRGELLTAARRGGIGYHPAALPQNRGRAVIPWTIIQGLQTTGSTLFWMDEGVDSGDILAQETFPVAPDETAASLYEKHVRAAGRLVRSAIPGLVDGTAPRVPQDHARATWCSLRTADDGLIDWSRPAREVWTLVRAAGEPYPGAFTFLGTERIVVREAAYAGAAPFTGLTGQVQSVGDGGALVRCGDGEHVLLRMVQRDGREPEPAAAVLRNHAKLGLSLLALYNGAVS